MPALRYILLGMLFFSFFNTYGQEVVGCSSSIVVDDDATDGIIVNNVCAELNDGVNKVIGNIEVKGSEGELTITKNIKEVTGDIIVKAGAILNLINDDIDKILGNIIIEAGATLIIDKDSHIKDIFGSIINDGTLIIFGQIEAKGTLGISGSGTTTLDGGKLKSKDKDVVIGDDATVIMNNGSTIEATKMGLVNNGTLESDGSGNTIKGGEVGITGDGDNGDFVCSANECKDDVPQVSLSSRDLLICSGDVSVTFNYSVNGRKFPSWYNVVFDPVAGINPFVDILLVALDPLDLKLVGGDITVLVPESAPAAIYDGELIFYDNKKKILAKHYISITIAPTPVPVGVFHN